MASVLLLLSQGDHSTQAKGNFNPTYSVSLCNSLTGHPNGTLNGAAGCADVLTTGANPNLTTNFGVPVGDLNFGFLAVMFDGDFTIAADAAIPDGEVVGGLVSTARLGLTNNPCNSFIPVPFTFFDATTDTTNTTSPKAEGEEDRNEPLAFDNTTGLIGSATIGEANDRFVKKYPTFLNGIFDPDNNVGGTNGPKLPLSPHALYAGMTVVAGTWIYLGFAIFSPGQLVGDDNGNGIIDGTETVKFTPSHPFSRFTADKGWVSITVLVPTDPSVYQGNPSPITDFCSDLVSTTMLLGVGQGGSIRFTSPASAQSVSYLTYSMSLRDKDNDGLENSLDTCVDTVISATWTDDADLSPQGGPHPYDPRVDDLNTVDFGPPTGVVDVLPDDDLDPDDDGIPGTGVAGSGCDPTPTVNTAGTASGGPTCTSTGPGDHDGDCFLNAGDSCALTINDFSATPAVGGPGNIDSETTVDYATAAPDGGTKTDQIGDQCDANDTTADGHFHVKTFVLGKCIGGTDGDGDGWCSTDDANDSTPAAGKRFGPLALTATDSTCAVPLVGAAIRDIDCDGFSDWIEGHLGTDAAAKCAKDTVAGNEALDSWPTDADDDKDTDIFDVLKVKPSFGTAPPSGSFNVRFDFDGDWDVDIFDVLKIKPHFGKTCTASIP